VIGAGELFGKGFDIVASHGRELRREQSGNSPQTKAVLARSTVEPRGHSEATGDFRPLLCKRKDQKIRPKSLQKPLRDSLKRQRF
jgi:hypothetical protein